ncbi:hypothetical protein KQX54_019274 [Cotesia glomerata]|uniref:Uncharacterized protein n=1 Tax=Cotesia glomerata TaxID=32391 RepID=A0AAV7HT88_COTGL|nr:hypothetical protein KQX54_019274 [Cotesia glomerata]
MDRSFKQDPNFKMNHQSFKLSDFGVDTHRFNGYTSKSRMTPSPRGFANGVPSPNYWKCGQESGWILARNSKRISSTILSWPENPLNSRVPEWHRHRPRVSLGSHTTVYFSQRLSVQKELVVFRDSGFEEGSSRQS